MKSFRTWSIFAKMNSIFLLILISMAINFAVVQYFRDKESDQEAIIDVAGRNRMLVQRISYFAEMIAQGKYVVKQDLAKAIQIKDASLQTLLKGGIPPGKDSMVVFEVASNEIALEIEALQALWEPFKTHAEALSLDTDSSAKAIHIAYIENNQEKLLYENNALVQFIQKEQIQFNKSLTYILVLLFTINCIILLTGVYIIRQSVVSPIKYLSGVASSMSQGHLEIVNFNKGKDEIGVLGKSLRKMTAVLRTTMLDIKMATKQINEASSQMSENSIQIAEGAGQEAEASILISENVETLSKVTKESTQKAYRTRDITAISLDKVQTGSAAFTQTMQTMHKIAKQIHIVKDISKQIDILAVNAAIEAARAGEAGRGFSVVANEVRKLADISKEASEQILAITNEGVKLAQVSQELLTEIIPQIEESTKLVSEIATENTDLSNHITEILRAIKELSSISGQNAAFSQSIADISEHLSKQSQQLHDTTEFFKVYKTEEK